MKTNKFLLLLAATVLTGALLACRLTTETPTVAPTDTLEAETPAPANTSAPRNVILPTLAPTPTLEPDMHYVAEYGLRIRHPSTWVIDDEASFGGVASLTSQDGQVIFIAFVEPAPTGASLKETAKKQSEALLAGLEKITPVLDQSAMLARGKNAWTLLSEAVIPDSGTKLKVNVTVSENGGRLYTFLIYSSTTGYTLHSGEVDTLLAGIDLETPSFYGIPRDQIFVFEGGESTNPREHDPATTHGSGDKRVFSGLVSFDPNLNLVPELAESWDVSTDGTVYTFHLRPNAVFHDGRPVTAGDVIYSWERAANPELNSDTVLTYLGDIVGVKEMRAGDAQHISGLKALDEHTLQVSIDAPKPYFLLKLTYPTAFIVDKANVEISGEWYRTPNGTGPYILMQWERFKVKIYQANPNFYFGAPAIPYIIQQIYSGVDSRLYEMGQVDIAGISSYDVERFSNPDEPLSKELSSAVTLCTGFINFDNSLPPFDDVKVRQAFTLAFDRQKYLDIVMNGVGVPANGLYPPGLPGFNTTLEAWSYNPERARQLLAESKYGGTENLPAIIYTTSGMGSYAGSGTSAVVDMWQKNLGVAITIQNIEPNVYIDQINAGNHGQIFDGGWCADYPDPENFADVLFHSEAAQNDSNYNNPETDAILEQARTESDVARRIELYQQAEQMIVNDAPALFTIHYISHTLIKPYIKGYVLTPVDIPIERYLWLDWSK